MAKIISPIVFGPDIGGPAYFTFQVPSKSAGAAARLVAVRTVITPIKFMVPPSCATACPIWALVRLILRRIHAAVR
jgi:hypothetical protein